MATRFAVDSSAAIAAVKQESGWKEVAPLLIGSAMSVVNATEVGDAIARLGGDPREMPPILAGLGITLCPADAALALIASELFSSTRRSGLSLGDRYCLALAKQLRLPALTGDRRWLDVADEIGVKVELFR